MTQKRSATCSPEFLSRSSTAPSRWEKWDGTAICATTWASIRLAQRAAVRDQEEFGADIGTPDAPIPW